MRLLYRTAPDLVTRKVGDEAVIVPIRNRVGDLESVFTLNDVALAVWNLLDGERTTEAIAATIADEYEVTPAEAATDVEELMQRLLEARLVEQVEG
ncbi:MAG: PqqD family protein [Acidobacteriota bacterium]